MFNYVDYTSQIGEIISNNGDLEPFFSNANYWVYDDQFANIPGSQIVYNGQVHDSMTGWLSPEISFNDYIHNEHFKLLQAEKGENLALTFYSFEEADKFSEALTKNTNLKKISINIDVPQHFSNNEQLQRIERKEYDERKLKSIQKLGAALQNHPSITELHIQNSLSDEDVYKLGVSLSQNNHLERLSLRNPEIGEKGVESIIYLLDKHPKLSKGMLAFAIPEYHDNLNIKLYEFIDKKHKLSYFSDGINDSIFKDKPSKLQSLLKEEEKTHPHTLALKTLLAINIQKKLQEFSEKLLKTNFEDLQETLPDFTEQLLLFKHRQTEENPFGHVISNHQLAVELKKISDMWSSIYNFINENGSNTVIERVRKSKPSFDKNEFSWWVREHGQLIDIFATVNHLKIHLNDFFSEKKYSHEYLEFFENASKTMNNLWSELKNFSNLSYTEKQSKSNDLQKILFSGVDNLKLQMKQMKKYDIKPFDKTLDVLQKYGSDYTEFLSSIERISNNDTDVPEKFDSKQALKQQSLILKEISEEIRYMKNDKKPLLSFDINQLIERSQQMDNVKMNLQNKIDNLFRNLLNIGVKKEDKYYGSIIRGKADINHQFAILKNIIEDKKEETKKNITKGIDSVKEAPILQSNIYKRKLNKITENIPVKENDQASSIFLNKK